MIIIKVSVRFLNIFTLLSLALLQNNFIRAQCCSGGSGSPIAGGASQGVLSEQQIELSTNVQFIKTDKFFNGDSPNTIRYFDSYASNYEYFRMAYGVSRNLTLSLESGYYFLKKETGLNKNPITTYSSKGIGDLIIFPRYDILNSTTENGFTELTMGLGFKIPLGSYNDSAGNVEPFSGKTFYVTKPLSVQLSSGSQDFIFYLFTFHGFTEKKFRVFANALYIKKGWNPNGEKVGDFSSIGIFASKTIWSNIGVTLQIRGERVEKMKLNENILLYAYPNYDPEATGYKKIFVSPQLSYSKGKFTFYGLTDIPVYQNLVKTQVGSQHQYTFGISYRFFVGGVSAKPNLGDANFACPMHPEVRSDHKGICSICGMKLERIDDKNVNP